jgi:single-strand DNA-binding protein
MDGVNLVTIIGNVGNITDLHVTNNDKKVINISIATSESFYDSANNKKAETQWHNIVLWNSLAEIGHKFIFKGCLLYIEGKLNYRKKQDGTSITEIVAKSIRVLSKRINGSDNEPIFFADDMDVE